MEPVQPTNLGFSCESAVRLPIRHRVRLHPVIRRSLVTVVAGAALAALVAACGSAAGSSEQATAVSLPAHYAVVPPSAVQTSGGSTGVFPMPGTAAASPRTEISFRGVAPGRIGTLRVTGSVSGAHAGKLEPHGDGRGASFVPAKPFSPGEHVTVATQLSVGTVAFDVGRPAIEPKQAARPAKKQSKRVLTFHSMPGVPITPIVVTRPATGAAPGLVFVGPKGGAGRPGLELLDSAGRIVWFSPSPKGLGQLDFREQVYRGKPVLTWWEGRSALGHGYGYGVIADEHYKRIATVHAGDGYKADLHEFALTSRGTALMTIYSPVRWDTSSIGGVKDGVALDGIVQEVELGTGHVLFEWHSLGTIPLTDSYEPTPKRSIDPYDFIHVNSISSDAHGDALVSGRGTHAVYDLDGRTGKLRWVLGGKHSTVEQGDGAATHSQHDAVWVAADTLSIFDNGGGVGGDEHKESRGIVVRLDAARKHATLLKEYPQPGGRVFTSQGNAQHLPDGHFFVGWGEGPLVTEFSAAGKVVFSFRFASGQSYRAYRFPWTGVPTTKPALAVDGGNAYVSWNGATQVRAWQLLSGGKVVATKPWAGLETTLPLSAGASAQDLQARALGAGGRVLASSAPSAVTSPVS